MSDGALRAGSAVALVATVLVSGWFRARADRQGGALPASPKGRLPDGIRTGLGVALLATLGAQVAAPSRVGWSLVPLPGWVRVAGLGLGLLVVPLVWWTFRSLGTNGSSTIATRQNAELVTAGPYRWVRHPIYTLGELALLAAALALESLILLGVLIPLLLWIPARARREEGQLLASFGERYAAYLTRTGRFLPALGRAVPRLRSGPDRS